MCYFVVVFKKKAIMSILSESLRFYVTVNKHVLIKIGREVKLSLFVNGLILQKNFENFKN